MTVPPPVPSYDTTDVGLDAAPTPRPVVRSRSSADAAGEWVARNGRAVGMALVVAAVGVAGVFAWRASERASAERGDRALYEAEARYAQGDPGATQALRQVTTRYGGTPAGAHARVLLAQTYYDQSKYADGLRAVESGSPPADWRGPTDRMRAVGEEGMGRPKDAAAVYERLAKDAGPDTRSSLLGDAARAYEAAGDAANARRVWQAVIDAGTPGAADEARVRLGELRAAAR